MVKKIDISKTEQLGKKINTKLEGLIDWSTPDYEYTTLKFGYIRQVPKQTFRDENKNLITLGTTINVIASSEVNPNGISGANDIARTWTISVYIPAVVKDYRRHAWNTYQSEYAKHYNYFRTEAEAVAFAVESIRDIIRIYNN